MWSDAEIVRPPIGEFDSCFRMEPFKGDQIDHVLVVDCCSPQEPMASLRSPIFSSPIFMGHQTVECDNRSDLGDFDSPGLLTCENKE